VNTVRPTARTSFGDVEPDNRHTGTIARMLRMNMNKSGRFFARKEDRTVNPLNRKRETKERRYSIKKTANPDRIIDFIIKVSFQEFFFFKRNVY
jgi:hypothetical protein